MRDHPHLEQVTPYQKLHSRLRPKSNIEAYLKPFHDSLIYVQLLLDLGQSAIGSGLFCLSLDGQRGGILRVNRRHDDA